MSSCRTRAGGVLRTTWAAIALVAAASGACAQYPGQVSKKQQKTPDLRAIAVLEWTGDEGKPKMSRLVPITVYDGQALQDGNVYLARPQPMALAYEVEYQLEKNGQPIGLYDIQRAGQEQGLWVGYGKWKPLPQAKLAAATPIDDDGFGANDDKPVLHRKHSDATSNSGANTGGSAGSGSPGEPSDPDRPTLHKKTGADDSSNGSGSTAGGTQGSSAQGIAAGDDPDRPVLHKSVPAPSHESASSSDGEHVNSTDPDRPMLQRGKPAGSGADVQPTMMGLPTEMHQAVAVSDAKTRPEHAWNYNWANPDDEDKMRDAMEDLARQALGLKAPAAPAPKRTQAAKPHAKPVPPAEPVEMVDVRFRVFELAYGSGATMVLSARTDAPQAQQKFVTIIAQPDLYGNPLVVLKNVTDYAHLDETPRMHLIDAVDALADNRGELLFELRGATQRQFALYRVLRGTAEKIFVTGGGEFGVAPGN